MAWARSLGEFGATPKVAEICLGKAQTLSIAVCPAAQAGNRPTANLLAGILSSSSSPLGIEWPGEEPAQWAAGAHHLRLMASYYREAIMLPLPFHLAADLETPPTRVRLDADHAGGGIGVRSLGRKILTGIGKGRVVRVLADKEEPDDPTDGLATRRSENPARLSPPGLCLSLVRATLRQRLNGSSDGGQLPMQMVGAPVQP